MRPSFHAAKGLLVVVPAERLVARLERAAGVAGMVQEHVGVEVPPRELADEGPAPSPPSPAPAPRARAPRGSRSAGTARARRCRPPGGRGGRRSAEPAVAAARACARGRRSRPAGTGARLGRRASAGGIRGSRPAGSVSARGAPWTSRRSSRSHTRQNGVKTVNGRPSARLAGADVGDEVARHAPHPGCRRAPRPRGGRGRSRTATRRRRSTPARPGLARQRGQRLLRPPSRRHELAAAGAQPRAQLLQAPQQELRPRRARGSARRGAGGGRARRRARRCRSPRRRGVAPGGRGRAGRGGARRSRWCMPRATARAAPGSRDGRTYTLAVRRSCATSRCSRSASSRCPRSSCPSTSSRSATRR